MSAAPSTGKRQHVCCCYVQTRMERVLSVWNMNLFIFWLNLMPSLCDDAAAGWEQGFEVRWIQKGQGLDQAVGQRDKLEAKAALPVTWINFWHAFSACVNFYQSRLSPRRDFNTRRLMSLTLPPDSCWRIVSQKQSEWFVCLAWSKRNEFPRPALISSVFILSCFQSPSSLLCSLLLSISASITTSISQHVNDQVLERCCYFVGVMSDLFLDYHVLNYT